MRAFIVCAAFAMHARCAKPEPPRHPQPPCSRRYCEALCGSRQMKHVVLASPSPEAADAAAAAAIVEEREEIGTKVAQRRAQPGR
jgi:hypothetical protein